MTDTQSELDDLFPDSGTPLTPGAYISPTPPRRASAPRTHQAASVDGLELALFPARQDAGDRRIITVDAVHALIEWSQRIGLDPWLGHVVYYFGKPYITELGAIALVKAASPYAGFHAAPENPNQPDCPQVPEGSVVWRCTVYLGPDHQPVEDWGVVDPQEIAAARELHKEKAEFLPVVRHPWQVAKARAVRRAHLRAVQPFLVPKKLDPPADT